MKTLGEIRRNIISFYSTIQDKVTDFSVGSVASGLFYSFSSALESAYAELEEVRQQAYVSTATGSYLDKLINGTFQLKRNPATRSTGYVVVFGEAPLTNFADIQLKYAEYDYTTGEFISGSESSTKFVGYNVQGDEGIVYSLIQPKNQEVVDTSTKLIVLDRSIQFLILPVASILKGEKANVREGGIYSFPSPPPGLSGVLNTSNPGSVFFASQQALSGSPFFSRFTEVIEYNNSTSSFSTLNSYSFSNTGFLELKSNRTGQKPILAVYSETPGGGGLTRQAGIVFEYIDASTNSITLKLPIENSLDEVPSLEVLDGTDVKVLTLDSFSYDGTVYTNPYDGTFDATLRSFVDSFTEGLIIEQRSTQVSAELIFDPDSILSPEYKISESSMVSGATDQDSDAAYRESLRLYLASLSKATNTALESGTISIPGVSFAKTLSSSMSPRGSAIVLASDDNGFLSPSLKSAIKESLNESWKAAGINVIVKSPELIPTNVVMTIRTSPGVFTNSVTQQVNLTVEEYLKGKLPGESVRYSDLLEAVSDIGGVVNVFNMVLTKGLTDDTYQQYKAQYDEALLVKASTSGIIEVSEVAPVDAGDSIIYDGSGGYTVEPDLSLANAIVYSDDGIGGLEVLVGNAEVLYEIYQSLVVDSSLEANNAEFYKNVILSHWTEIFSSREELIYFLSYALGEPFIALPSSNYPIDVDNVNYQYIRDYTATEVEIFRVNNITVNNNVSPLIGIRYI